MTELIVFKNNSKVTLRHNDEFDVIFIKIRSAIQKLFKKMDFETYSLDEMRNR